MISSLFFKPIFLVVVAFLIFNVSSSPSAQELEQDINELSEGVIMDDIEIEDRLKLTNTSVTPKQISSLFFTTGEIALLRDAKKGLFTRPPTEAEVQIEQNAASDDRVLRPNSVREIALGGILYHSSNDWTIWLNSQKITPKNIPSAIIDITVTEEHIKMKWLDFQTNQIFPVKLRANQRFNFDTRIFLPG